MAPTPAILGQDCDVCHAKGIAIAWDPFVRKFFCPRCIHIEIWVDLRVGIIKNYPDETAKAWLHAGKTTPPLA